MRILHVGFGFQPWIVNGLVIYCENIMDGQVQEGHQVGYFFAGRQLPVIRRPLLYRWKRGGVRMFEWMNSTLVVGRHRGTPDPERDLTDAPTEEAFRRVLKQFRPDVVHVHDLGGLPSSLLGVAQERAAPVVMTLHDYHTLCPTIKLYDAHRQVCLRRHPGEMCVVCCAGAPLDNREELESTLLYTRASIRAGVPYLDAALRRPAIDRLGAAGIRLAEWISGLRGSDDPPLAPAPESEVPAPATARAYQRRRDGNVARLNQLDVLIANSRRSGEIWRQLGVEAGRMRMARMTPSHIDLLRPKRCSGPGQPMRFAVLNGCASTEKGADLIADTLTELSRRGMEQHFRLTVRGWVAPHVRPVLAAHPSVQLGGHYGSDELDSLLEDVDVGLMPSVWEEVCGFVGLEFLAKGIPVIGNQRGGIPEYVRPGETGWLNRSCSAPELADIMTSAIEDPAEVQRLGRSAVELREVLIEPFSAQLSALAAIYEEVLARPSP